MNFLRSAKSSSACSKRVADSRRRLCSCVGVHGTPDKFLQRHSANRTSHSSLVVPVSCFNEGNEAVQLICASLRVNQTGVSRVTVQEAHHPARSRTHENKTHSSCCVHFWRMRLAMFGSTRLRFVRRWDAERHLLLSPSCVYRTGE